MRSQSPLRVAGRTFSYLLLVAAAVISLVPIYWMFITSIQLDLYTEHVPPLWYPVGIVNYFKTFDPTWLQQSFDTLQGLFLRQPIGRWFFNSAYIAVVVTGGILLLDSMAAYALAKKQFPGRKAAFWAIIGTMMIPGQVTLVPLFIMIRVLGMIDTHWALILPDLSMVFGVFLLRQFMLSGVPNELLEAAKIDGANEWQTYTNIVLPLSTPALATLGIFTFTSVWNSFLWPVIVLNKKALMTLPVALKLLQDQNLAIFKLLMAGAAVAALPTIIVFLLFQRYFIKGLTVGSLKG
ncbi:MAG TPA: carbohydrate ABC transporter permease [Symbiobacteriaceae bacterium]|jgi:multiple sugar transport system permease protein|nr:carbohydrate ABC transporter permease [Symbiobacteriaceae bacterium]